MPDPTEGNATTFDVQPAPTWLTDLAGTVLTKDPHHLLIRNGEHVFRLTDCACDACAAFPALGVLPKAEPQSFAAWLISCDVRRIELNVHRDLALPGGDGAPSRSLVFVQRWGQAMAEAGVRVEFFTVRTPTIGAWYRATAKYRYGTLQFVVPGMLGQVRPDPGGVCTPGISTMLRMVGGTSDYGFPARMLEPLDGEPTEAELEEAKTLARGAFSAFEAEYGPLGIIQTLDGRLHEEASWRREIAVVTKRLGHPSLKLPDQKGLTKRLRGLLEPLAESLPRCGAAELVSAVDTAGIPLPKEVLDEVMRFTEKPMKG